MKKVFASLVTAAFVAAMILPPISHGQSTGQNPARRATDSAPSQAANAEDRYVIKFRQFGSFAAALVEGEGGKVVHEFPDLAAIAARLPEEALLALQNSPYVEFIEADAKRFPMQTGNPPWSDSASNGETTPYGFKMVQADQLNDTDAANRKVCIIDSGFYRGHEDLPSLNVTGDNDPNGAGNWDEDGSGHGTHVAGTIAAIGGNGKGVVGVLPNGKLNLHIIRVFGDDGAWAYSSDLANAVGKCRNAGANVISMSLGGALPNSTEQTAFNNAYNAGVLSIAAAGNAGTTATSYPAGYGSVVSVAAVDSNEAVASFSQKNADVEIAAPGVAVLSSVPSKETNTLTVNGVTYNGNYVTNAARSAGANGTVVNGGLCDAVGAWSGAVVLCQRGTIGFVDKVRNVQSGGGLAAVIYNNAPGGFFGTLGDGNTSTIPAISLSQEDGQAASAQAGSPGTVVSQVEQPASGYSYFDGTSMATPHVSAVAALVWSSNPAWTNAQIRSALTSTAKDKGTAGRDTSYGYGIVQAKAALDSLQGGGGGSTGTAPNAPSDLGAAAVSKSQINLSWADNSSNEDGFRIERCAVQGTSCSFAQIASVGPNSTGYSNMGLKGNTTYRYRVRAYNAGGDSGYSNTASATTPRR